MKPAKETFLESDLVFLVPVGDKLRPIGVETRKNCWPRACKSLGVERPRPRFHDLRHTWRANARRSGVDRFIAESIMGHCFRGKTVNERYGRISD